jgi:hypothetical protein
MAKGHDPTDTTGQERTEAEHAKAQHHRQEQERNDLCKVMSSKEGRRFIWRQLSEAGVFRSSFNVDAGVMAFNEGTRSAGLKLLGEIMDACPQRYLEAQREYIEAKERDEQRRNASR